MTFLTRYRPVANPLRDLDRFMDEAFVNPFLTRGENVRQWWPETDVSETTEFLTLRLEVPGLNREDLKISVENNVLSVRGEKKQEMIAEDETFYRTERSYGAFERSFSLPAHINSDAVKAELIDGVLTVRFPRREDAKVREIEIEGNGQPERIEA